MVGDVGGLGERGGGGVGGGWGDDGAAVANEDGGHAFGGAGVGDGEGKGVQATGAGKRVDALQVQCMVCNICTGRAHVQRLGHVMYDVRDVIYDMLYRYRASTREAFFFFGI